MTRTFTITFSHPLILNGFEFFLTNEQFYSDKDLDLVNIHLINDFNCETELDMRSINSKAFSNLCYAFCKLAGYNPDMQFFYRLGQIVFSGCPYEVGENLRYLYDWLHLQDMVVSSTSYRCYNAIFRILNAAFNADFPYTDHLFVYGTDIDGCFQVLNPQKFYSSPVDFSEIHGSFLRKSRGGDKV